MLSTITVSVNLGEVIDTQKYMDIRISVGYNDNI